MSEEQREFAAPRGPRGRQGDKGEPGEPGKQGIRGQGMQLRSRRAVAVLILVLFVLEGLNLEFTAQWENHSQAAARAQGILIEHRICTTMGELAANKPPPGNPATNPSRAYDQRNHAILDQLGPDLGCRRQR
jgi:hypothetical protein